MYSSTNILPISFLSAMLLASCMISAQDRPDVQVLFQISYENYRIEFNSPGLSTLSEYEETARDSMMAWLNAQFPFLAFQAASASHSIEFNLTGNSLGLKVQPTLNTQTETYQTPAFYFRELAAVQNSIPPTPQAFAGELKLRFLKWVNEHESRIIEDLFSHVPLCDKATPRPESEDWALPFTKEDLKIDNNSQFKVMTLINQGSKACDFETTVSGSFPEFNNSIRCSFKGPVNIECLQEILASKVQGVYLTHFEPLNTLFSDFSFVHE